MTNNDGIKTEVISSHEEFLKKLTNFVSSAESLHTKIEKTLNEFSMLASQTRIIGKTIRTGLDEAFKSDTKNPVAKFFNKIKAEMQTSITSMTNATTEAIDKMAKDISKAMSGAMSKASSGASGQTGGKGGKKKAFEDILSSSIDDIFDIRGLPQKFDKKSKAFVKDSSGILDAFFRNISNDQASMLDRLSKQGKEGRVKTLINKVFTKMKKDGMYDLGDLDPESNFKQQIKRSKEIADATKKANKTVEQNVASVSKGGATSSIKPLTFLTKLSYTDAYRILTGKDPTDFPKYEEAAKQAIRNYKRVATLAKQIESESSKSGAFGVGNFKGKVNEKQFDALIANAGLTFDKSMRKNQAGANKKPTGGSNGISLGDLFNSVTGMDANFVESPNKMADILRGISEKTGSVLGNMANVASTAISNIGTVLKVITGMVIGAGAAFVGLGYQIKNWGSEILLTTEKVRGFNIALLGMMKTQSGVDKFMGTAFKVAQDFPVGFEQTYQIAKSMSMIQPLRPMLMDAKKSQDTMDKVFQIALSLNAMEPEWGIQGAMFTLKEALAGDMMSLKRRYEVPVNLITTMDGKKLSDVKNNPSKMLEGLYGNLSNIFNKGSMVQLSRQFGNILGQIESAWFQFKAKIGDSGFYDVIVDDLLAMKKKLQEFMASGNADAFAKRISNSLNQGYQAVKKFSLMVMQSIGKLFGVDLQKGVDGYAEGLTKIIEGYARIAAGGFNWITENKDAIIEAAGQIYSTVTKYFTDITDDVKSATKSVAEAATELIKGSNDILDTFGIKDSTKAKGIFLLWLFGPGNVVALIASTVTAGLMAATTAYKAWQALGGITGTVAAATPAAAPAAPGIMARAGTWLAQGIGGAAIKAASVAVQLKTTISDVVRGFGSGETLIDQLFKMEGGATITTKLLGRDWKTHMDNYQLSLAKIKIKLDEIMPGNTLDAERAMYRPEIVKRLTEANYPQSELDFVEVMHRQIGKVSQAYDDSSKKSDIYAQKGYGKSESGLYGIAKYMTWDNPGQVGNRAYLEARQMLGYDNISQYYKNNSVSDNGLDISDRKKISDFASEAQTKFGLEKMITDIFRKDAQPGSQHNVAGIANAFDIGGSAMDKVPGITKDPEFFRFILRKAKEMGGLVRLEQNEVNKWGDFQTMWESVKEDPEFKGQVEAKFGDKTRKEGTYALHFDLNKTTDNIAKETIASTKEVIKDGWFGSLGQSLVKQGKWMAGLVGYNEGGMKNKFTALSFPAATNSMPALKPTAMDELMGGSRQTFNNFQQRMNDLETPYREELFAGDYSKVIKDFNEKNILFGQALRDAITSNLESTVAWYDRVIGEVESKQMSFTEGSQTQINDAKEARAKVQSMSEKSMSRVGALGKDAIQMMLSKMKYENTGYSIVDQTGIRASLLQEQVSMLQSQGKLSTDKFSDFAEVLTRVQFLMRSGLGMGQAVEELKTFDKELFEGSNLLMRLSAAQSEFVTNNLELFKSDPGRAMAMMSTIPAQMIKNIDRIREAAIELAPVVKQVIDMEDYAQRKGLLQRRSGVQSALGNAPSIRRVDDLMNAASASGYVNRTLYRSSLDTKIGLLEDEGMKSGDAFKLGIDRALADWKTFTQQMVEFGTQAVTELTGIFENNFFDFLSGKIRGLGGLISGVLGSVKDMVLKMVSKLLALQTMKIILGVNVDSSGNFVTGSSGGSAQASGSLEGILGGKSGGLSGSLMSMGKSALSKVIQGKSGGAKGSSGSSLLGGAGLGGAMKYLSSTKLSSLSLKGLTKASGINPTMLAAGVALNFLTQPGRLFGGTVDKTQAAKSAFSNVEEWRKSLEEGRAGQAAQYMYGGGANLMGYNFTPAVYKETKSGNGITKKKTKTGQVDVSGFSASVEGYYKELFGSAMAHYAKQRDIDKLRESSEGSALKEELKYKNNYLGIIRSEYDKLSGKSGKTQDDFKKMDDLRDKIAQTFDDVIKSEKAMAEAFREEALKKKEYDLFMSFGLGKNDMALEQGMLGVQKQRLDALAGTSAWYDANMEYLSSSKDLADKLRDTAESIYEEVKSSKIGAIRGGAYAGTAAVASTISSMESNYQKILEGKTGKDIRNQIGSVYGITGTVESDSGSSNGRGNRVMGSRNQMGMIPQYQFGSNAEAIRFYEKENKAAQTRLYGANIAGEYSYRKQNLFSGASTGTLDELSRRDSMAKAIRDVGGAGAGVEASEEYYNALKEFQDQQFVVADEIKSMMSSGLIEKSSVDIISLMEGSVEDFKNVFLNVQKQFREKQFSQSILETVKGFESGSQFTDIVSQISGMGGLGSSKGYMVDLLGGMGVGADPYQSWYNYALETTQTKIRNAEVGGDEMFTAYNDLFSLLSENAEHLKAKAEATNAKMEESLDVIEQTLKVRLAEERKSMKGDVYFMDTSTYDISPTQIQALRDKLKNNDPDAYMLLEEIKRKVSGTSR